MRLGELEPLGHRDYLKEVSAAVTWVPGMETKLKTKTGAIYSYKYIDMCCKIYTHMF